MKNKRIKVAFDDKKFLEGSKQFTINERKAVQCLNFIEQITGLRNIISIDEIGKHITTKTGFENIEASAELLNLSEAFYYLKMNLDSVLWNNLDITKDGAITQKTVINEFSQICTTYLNEQFLEEYETLEQACSILNKLKRQTNSRFLNRNYNGVYSVNLQGLQNSNFI